MSEFKRHLIFGIVAFTILTFALGYATVAFVTWDVAWVSGIGTWDPPGRIAMLLGLFGAVYVSLFLAVEYANWEPGK